MEGHSNFVKPSCCFFLLGLVLFIASVTSSALARETHNHQFIVQATLVKRLCKTHNIITVNGQYLGPNLKLTNGDTLVIKVVNKARYNVTIQWHGIRQMRTGWADRSEFVTQCPIHPRQSYTYRFTVDGQEGTLWWHTRSSWLRATVYGTLIIYPKQSAPYPFSKPKRETPVLLVNGGMPTPLMLSTKQRELERPLIYLMLTPSIANLEISISAPAKIQ